MRFSGKKENGFDGFRLPEIAISFGSKSNIHGLASLDPVIFHPLLALDVSSANCGDHFLRDQSHVALDA